MTKSRLPRWSHRLLFGSVVAAAFVGPRGARAEPISSEPEVGTTVVSHPIVHGGYVAPEARLTSLAGSAALLLGGEVGWILDHVFVIGGAVYTLVGDTESPAELQPVEGARASLDMTYGGARIAVVPWADHRLHLVFGVLGGAGKIGSSGSSAANVSDGFAVFEPDAAIEANLAQPVRLAIGGSYRFTTGTGIASLTPIAVNGPTAFLTIKLGVF